jgi:folylpolyglutamate synthase/dihydropteroate synthase
LADEIILTQASSLRAAKAGFIENIIRTPNPSRLSFGSGRDPAFAGEPRTSIIKTTSILEAVKTAQKKASARDLILITGSLFVVGEARELFKQK